MASKPHQGSKPARSVARFMLARSAIVGGLALAAFIGGAEETQNAVANGDTRTLTLYHTHSRESLTVTFKRDGRYDSDGLKKLNYFLRDWRSQDQIRMEPRLFDIVWEVYQDVGGRQPINIVSAYRSPATNAMLRSRSRGVAKHSQHMLGRAMDFYIPGVDLAKIRAAGLRLQRGGVGYYPTSGSPFVHLDAGNVRHWPRMTRDQLAKIFPDGRTIHIPSDGRPMSGYALALADVQRNGGATRGSAMASARGGSDDDEGGTETASAGGARSGSSFFSRIFRDDGDKPTPVRTARVESKAEDTVGATADGAATAAADAPMPVPAPFGPAAATVADATPVTGVPMPRPSAEPVVAMADPVAAPTVATRSLGAGAASSGSAGGDAMARIDTTFAATGAAAGPRMRWITGPGVTGTAVTGAAITGAAITGAAVTGAAVTGTAVEGFRAADDAGAAAATAAVAFDAPMPRPKPATLLAMEGPAEDPNVAVAAADAAPEPGAVALAALPDEMMPASAGSAAVAATRSLVGAAGPSAAGAANSGVAGRVASAYAASDGSAAAGTAGSLSRALALAAARPKLTAPALVTRAADTELFAPAEMAYDMRDEVFTAPDNAAVASLMRSATWCLWTHMETDPANGLPLDRIHVGSSVAMLKVKQFGPGLGAADDVVRVVDLRG